MPNFKFGQPVTGNVFSLANPYGRNATARNRTTASCTLSATPSIPGQTGGVGGAPRLGGYDISRFNPAYDRLEEGSVIEDWIPRDLSGLNKLFRIIYTRDSICGPAIDIMSNLPWSSFDLHGVDDKKILQFYEEASQLYGDKAQEMPAITIEYLVLGRFCASLIYDEEKGFWTDFVPHDSDFLTITPIPVRNFDPKLDLVLSPGVRQFVNSADYRDLAALRKLPESLVQAMRRGQPIPLDPLNTIYLRRKSSPTDFVGTSLLTRTVPYWAVEKALMNAMVTAARRRAGNILHITAGIDERWDPSPEEMEDIAGLFIQADEDPVGAVVATRTGVDTSEVRSGGDIWKWSDEWQWLSEAKMRGIGISEALLAGDACVTGDTLVTTSQGLLRIGDIRRKSDGEWQDIDLTVASRYGPGKAVKWYYNGVKPTLKIDTDLGYGLQCTHNHPFLVLRGTKTEWVRADALVLGDLVCVNDKPMLRTERLLFTLSQPEDVIHGGQRKPLRRPSEMEPELAFLLGLIVSEAAIRPSASQVRFSNTDKALHERFSKYLETVFGLTASLRPTSGSNSGYQGTKPCYESIVCSKTCVEWLQELGCVPSNGNGGARHKVVPWSILQADRDSQLAYLAGFIEGDGSTAGHSLTLHSSSESMLRQLQTMLAAHGHISRRYPDRIAVLTHDSVELWEKIRGYMNKQYERPPCKLGRVGYELPLEAWRQLLSERMARDGRSVYFVDEVGRPFRVPDWNHLFYQGMKCFRYDSHAAGKYDRFLAGLQHVSADAHRDLVSLLEAQHVYTRVTSIRVGDEQDVYDLSMFEGGEPAFVANSFMIHNTYANAEQARSTFTEQIISMRQFLTNQLYYRRFKTLARAHGFRKRKKAELDHRVRIHKDGRENKEPELRKDDLSLENLSQEEAFDIPEEDLIVPTLQWHKSLLPEGDRDYLDILSTLKEEGIPIPLKVWAARGGYDLTEALNMLEEDVKLREKVKEWQKKTGGGEDEEGGGSFGEASTDASPLWDPADRFMHLRKADAKQCLQKLVDTVYQPGKHHVLADTKYVTRTCSEILHDDRKVELMAYVLMRLGVCRGLPVSAKTAGAIVEYLAKKPNLSVKRRMQELNAAHRILNQYVDDSDPVVDECLAGVLKSATGPDGLALQKPALRIAK